MSATSTLPTNALPFMASEPEPATITRDAVRFLGEYALGCWILVVLARYLVEEPAALVAVTAAIMKRELSESLS